ncbi:MAG: hypothetical protein LBP98_00040 [Tannerella sp.]|jgi:hypothetical protein|nr:hypothetical protein [Tannerella sp.]
MEPMKFLPEQYEAYQVSEWMDYAGEALYDYINGGAELYLSYGLAGMTGCKYNGEGLPQITVEIYEMTSSANAFGVYTQSRDKEESDFGQGSQSFNDFILFWKGKYYAIITTQKATPESTKTIRQIAALIDSAIPETGSRPDIIDALPPNGLTPGGYLYFHHYVWLNAYLFIADYNIVNITDETHAVLARYGSADNRCYLLVIDYPDPSSAGTAFVQLKEKFAPESTDIRPVLQLEDQTWFSTWTQGKRLWAVFNGHSLEVIENLYHSINK